jgi:hypothetical protein
MTTRLVFLALLICLFIQPSVTKAQGTIMGFCVSNVGQPVVYFTPIFDSKIPSQLSRLTTTPWASEFNAYLIGRFDFKSNQNFGGGCAAGRMLDMEESKRKLENQVRQGNRQVVELEWKYTPNPVEVALYVNNKDSETPPTQRPNATYCLSESYQGTFYYSGPFETGSAENYSLWSRGFYQNITQRYGFKGNSICNSIALDLGRRFFAALNEGARAGGRKVVDTGWKYDPSTVVTKPAAPRDDDPEPAPRPAAPKPTNQSRDAAVKELPESKAFCSKDPMLSIVFNCDNFARSVYNYRTGHPTDTSTLASLIAADKVYLADAIDNTHVDNWVNNRGQAQKLDQKVINCVSQNVIVTLQKKPQANHLQDFYKDAVAACTK